MENIKLAQIIDKAIGREEEAFAFYMKIQGIVEDPTAKDTLGFLANEEKKHREFLVAYRDGKIGGNNLRMTEVIDYKIAQFLDAPDVKKNSSSQEIYLIAAHREMNSYNFYKGLSEAQPAGEVKDMLQRMANEEMKHKEKVEYLYTNTAFPQTQGG
jgi:rubrerythrin